MNRLLPAVLLLAGCAAPVGLECPDGAPLCAIAEVVGEDRSPAGGVSITGVEVNQAVGIPLFMDGEAVDEVEVPLVAHRDTLVRAFVEPQDDWQNREISLRAYLYDGERLVGAGAGTSFVDGPSSGGDLGTTVNAVIEGFMVPPGELRLEIELVEVEGVATLGGRAVHAWPDGDAPVTLISEDTGPVTRIYLVPVDSGQGPPDVGDGFVQSLRGGIQAWYPVPEVEIEVGEPLMWDRLITGPGDLGPLLSAMPDVREERDIGPDVYVYGIQNTYGGGLSQLAGQPENAGGRHSVGGTSLGVISHEIGHAHGRQHAPCPLPGEPGAPAGQDPNYPHEKAQLGAWGWDHRSDTLWDPTENTDFMSYCDGNWISDYTWHAMLRRTRDIHEAYNDELARTGERQLDTTWDTVWVHDGGGATFGRPLTISSTYGESTRVTLIAADGTRTVVDARWAPHSHGEGGVLYLPRGTDFVDVVWDRGPLTPVGLDVRLDPSVDDRVGPTVAPGHDPR